jgi:hypothetical protein
MELLDNIKEIPDRISRFADRVKMTARYWRCSDDIYDYDYTSVLIAERMQLQMLHEGITKYHNHVNTESDLAWIALSIRLINVILEEDESYFEYPKNRKVSLRPCKRYFCNIELEGDNVYTLKRHINTANYKRYFSNLSEKQYHTLHRTHLLDIELYKTKCWYLYNRIRAQHLFAWWD